MSFAESQARLDAVNYHNDPRTGGEREAPTVWVDDEPVALPTKFDVCPVCEGNGTHVNPAIDAGGLSSDAMDDPDFMDSYREGHYDITCDACAGRRVVPVVDESQCTPDMLAQWHQQQDDDADYRALCAAEIRAGC